MSVQPENIGLDNKSAAVRDRIEINHEIAGVDVGRMQRFLNNGDNALNSENSEKKKSERAMTMLRYMLENDAQYTKRYFEVADKLDKAQQAVDRALIDINQRLAVSDRELQKMEDNSAKVDDGTSVFKSSDGSIYDQDGQRLSDEDAQKVSVPEDAPSWEDYKAEKEKREVLVKDKQDIERYESEVLKPAQERMQNQDDPMSLDEFDELEGDIEREKSPALTSYGYNSDHKASIVNVGSVAAEISTKDTASNKQELSGKFNDASFDLTDDLDMPTPATPSAKPAQTLAI